MGRWRGFLDSIATTGGHIFVLIYLLTFGAVLAILGEVRAWMGIAKIGEGVATGAFGALLMMYKPSGTNSEQIARAGQPYQPPTPKTPPTEGGA